MTGTKIGYMEQSKRITERKREQKREKEKQRDRAAKARRRELEEENTDLVNLAEQSAGK